MAGDGKSPKEGLWDPFQMAVFMAEINGDDPSHLRLPGMILQVAGLIKGP